MTEQTNTQSELDTLQERVRDALREDILDDLRERMRDAGRHVLSAHNLVSDVFDEALEVDVPEEFLDTVEECLDGLNALRGILNPAILFGGESE